MSHNTDLTHRHNTEIVPRHVQRMESRITRLESENRQLMQMIAQQGKQMQKSIAVLKAQTRENELRDGSQAWEQYKRQLAHEMSKSSDGYVQKPNVQNASSYRNTMFHRGLVKK